MRYLKFLSSCLLALTLHSTAWAQIYETKDAQGNPEFTDSPATEGAVAVDLQETNLADAPQPEPQEQSQSDTEVVEQAPVQENNTVIVHDGDNAYDEIDPAARREVLDGEAPREVGDYDAQMPREVGDTDAQMPREVGDSEAQMPREVGDFPGATGAHRR